jgi:hypothetical protein
MSVKCEWTEQEIIDDLLCELKDSRKSIALHNHFMYCKHCQNLHDYWSKVLKPEDETVDDVQPSPMVKQRIYNTIAKPETRWKFHTKQWVAACIGVFLLASSFYVGRLSVHEAPVHPGPTMTGTKGEVRTGYLPNQKLAYRVVPVHNQNTDGYVWVNPNTKDIMLFLDGLKPIEGRDYQAWLVSNNDKENAGILQIDQSFAHVIVHNPHMPRVDRIIISIEPQGGSSVQTGPKAIDLDLRE